jgi:hypothetical protein
MPLTHKEKVKALEDLKRHHHAIDTTYDCMANSCGAEVESPVWTTIFNLLAAYISTVAKLCDIHEDVLFWHVYENDWGKRGFEVIMEDGTEIVVTDIESFLKTV